MCLLKWTLRVFEVFNLLTCSERRSFGIVDDFFEPFPRSMVVKSLKTDIYEYIVQMC